MKRLIFALTLLLAFSLFYSCSTEKTEISPDIEFGDVISAYTSGIVSRRDIITIRFKDEIVEEAKLNVELSNQVFDFSPNIDGKLIWVNKQTLNFVPNEYLKENTEYIAKLDLKALGLENEKDEFVFSFRTIEQMISASFSGMNYYEQNKLDLLYLKGEVSTSDVTDNETLETSIQAKINNKTLNLSWKHLSNGNKHQFTIDSVPRTETAGEVILSYDGASMNSNSKGQISKEIPALGDFKIINSKYESSPQPKVIIAFSDPLDEGQNLRGLVRINNTTTSKTSIVGNEIHLFPETRLSGQVDIIVSAGIKNVMGYKLLEETIIPLQFDNIPPNIEFTQTDKTILPSSEGLIVPFRAVSLAAVDVKVIKIFEDNIHQFLQVNQLQGSRDLKRVGRVVRNKTVELSPNGDVDLGNWNTYFLDISDLVKTEAGAIYRLELSYRMGQSIYQCEEDNFPKDYVAYDDHGEEDGEYDRVEQYYYDYYYEDYYDDYDYYEEYDYSQRENPCNPSFYRYPKRLSRNILASDLGIIAKKGTDNSWEFATSNLLNAAPEAGVRLELFNYQERSISTVTTDNQGFANINELNAVPFLLVASKGTQRGYLKLNDGENLNLSQFDVGGNFVREGVKGMIYGERGVWRPGDTLFVSFILQDEYQSLPSSHPLTFELFDARGRLAEKQSTIVGNQQLFTFPTPTSYEAPTGNWRAQVRIGGAVFSKTLKVESIKPNRLKIDLEFDENLSTSNGILKGKLKLQWLHGAIAKNLKSKIEVTTKAIRTSFEGYEDYTFDDPAREYNTTTNTAFEGKVNELGEANINYNIEMNNPPPGMLKAYFDTKAFEAGGEFSVDQSSTVYSPYNHYVGVDVPQPESSYALETGIDHKIKLQSLDANGRKAGNRKLSYVVYKVDWKWWWHYNRENFSRFISREGNLPLMEGNLTTDSKGAAFFTLNIEYPNYGRYFVRVEDQDGHASGEAFYIDWPSTYNRSNRESLGGASMLLLSTNKDKYQVGDECVISFPSNEGGNALLTIEDGVKVIKKQWLKLAPNTTKAFFKIEEGMAPNVYAHITLMQGHKQTANDAPIRMYGVVPVVVEDPNTRLEPVISMADKLRPESKYSIKVSEANGKEMKYTLAVVDEGLLALTRFKTPDPHAHFYAKEALGVQTWDMYDDVISASGVPIDHLLKIGGGDENETNPAKNKANRFKPVVSFVGPFTLKPGQTKTHELLMPNYVGEVRVMLVAVQDDAFGSAEKSVKVKDPLMVLATLPRVLGPGEEVMLPVNVFAMEDHVKNVKVSISSDQFLIAQDSKTKDIQFSETGDQIVLFPLKVANKTGISKLTVNCVSGNEKARYDFEIEVRNPNPPTLFTKESAIAPGDAFDLDFDFIGTEGTNKLHLEVSGLPPFNLAGRMAYLLRYPHGCVEQTTSKAFPQLFLDDIAELTIAEKEQAQRHIQEAIKRLSNYQNNAGGFAYWPGNSDANDWGTSYAGHFLLEAELRGYSFPASMKSAWLRYQKEIARNWRPDPNHSNAQYLDMLQAYRLYTLALAGEADLSAMNRLKAGGTLSQQAKWRLAAAYAMAGQKEAAKTLVIGSATKVQDYEGLYSHWGSGVRDEAMILETLLLLDMKTEAASLALDISKSLNMNSWRSTQTTAYAIIALSKFGLKSGKGPINIDLNYNGDNRNYTIIKPMMLRELDVQKISGNKLRVVNKGDGLIFVRMVNEGQALVAQESAQEDNLQIGVSYLDEEGNEIDVRTLEQGTDFIAKVDIYHPGIRGWYSDMALSQIFPSGWEIINERLLSTNRNDFVSEHSEYRDYRDDRVYTYFSLGKRTSRTYYVRLNAAYLGKFYLPAVDCQAMYDNTIHANTEGMWVNVVMNKN